MGKVGTFRIWIYGQLPESILNARREKVAKTETINPVMQ